MDIEKIKKKLALVFNDNTQNVVYKNYLDYTIWFLIFLSTLEVFLSTFSGIMEKYGYILDFIDIFTTFFLLLKSHFVFGLLTWSMKSIRAYGVE